MSASAELGRTLAYEPPSTPASSVDPPALANLKAALGSLFRISIPDGRVFEGRFVCIDRDRNIILQDAEEQRASEGTASKRSVGLVMIPGDMIQTAEYKAKSRWTNGEIV